ncbi:hypothetical protein, partial [Bacteroides cellulosilyticus]|uniref:hypothetical protein n=1 Tax=Bacteroides cellulosilyticus TaxID=246787 RepID=UPI00234CE835
MKANHSRCVRVVTHIMLLLILQRYYFESESQHYKYNGTPKMLLLILQRYYFESESQPVNRYYAYR